MAVHDVVYAYATDWQPDLFPSIAGIPSSLNSVSRITLHRERALKSRCDSQAQCRIYCLRRHCRSNRSSRCRNLIGRRTQVSNVDLRLGWAFQDHADRYEDGDLKGKEKEGIPYRQGQRKDMGQSRACHLYNIQGLAKGQICMSETMMGRRHILATFVQPGGHANAVGNDTAAKSQRKMKDCIFVESSF